VREARGREVGLARGARSARLDGAGRGDGARPARAWHEVEETLDGWAPSGGEREGEGDWLGRFGLRFQFFLFPSPLIIEINVF
jgi:hypothetical protein